jgi:gliding motility-associated-like protein
MKKLLLLLFMFAGLNVFGQISENFESATFPPTGWTTFTNGIGTTENWSIENTTPAYIYQGLQSAYVYPEDVPDGTFAEDWLVTPAVTVPANGILKFYNRKFFPGANYGSNYALKISSTSQTNTATFTNVQTWGELALFGTNTGYADVEVNLAAYAGQTLYFAFVLTTDDGDGWLIDNININAACNVPTALAVSNVGASIATLGWTGPAGASQWEVETVLSLNNFTGTGTFVATNSYIQTGLQENTAYKYRVRAVCSTGISSNWSDPVIFLTNSFGEACNDPIVVSTLPYQTTNNTGNFSDPNDIQAPTLCTGAAANYMNGNDVFYSFTPTFTGQIAISLSPTANFSSVHVYSACPGTGGATCLAGVGNTNSNIRNINPFNVTAGQTYYIIISSYVGNTPLSTQQTVGYTLTIQQVFCTQPPALTAVNTSATSADLSWGATPGITSWEVSYAPAPYGLPTVAGVTTGVPFSATGLVPGVVYQYYVRASCNDGTFSIWSGPFTFSTPQIPTALNFIDTLETLTGWTLNNGTQTNKWALGNAVNNGGTKSLYISESNGVTNAYNITNTSVSHAYKDFIIPAGATQVELNFDWRSVGQATDYLRVWTVPSATTITAGSPIGATANRINVTGDLTGNSNFITRNHTLNVTPYAGSNMRVVFEWTNDATGGVQPPAAIDNIKLDLVTCPKPGNLVISNIGYNTAQVTWANGAVETAWEVLVLPTGSPAPTASTAGTPGTSPFTISGLTSVTCYTVYVRAKCGPSDFSVWSVPVNFCTTPNYCAGDHFYDTGGIAGNYQNSETNITSIVCPDNVGDVVTVVFNNFNVAAGDTLQIRNGNLPTSPVVGTYTGTTLPPSFTSTSPTGCLTFIFNSNGTTTSTGWDATIYCTPPITCPKPTSVVISNITATSIDLTWTESGSATDWQVLVVPAGSNVPAFSVTGNNFSTTTITFPGLSPSTAYTVYVRAICSNTDKSFWTDGINFSTTPVNDNCINAIQAIVNSDLECTNPNLVDLKGATPSITSGTCNANANDIWYKFTAISTTQAIQIEGTNAVIGSVEFALYSGTCTSLNLLQCGTTTDVAGPTTPGNTINGHVANGLTIGQTYYIRLFTTSSTATSIPFSLCIGSISCNGADPLCDLASYDNSTDVIDFGDYSTVNTSPNPKFFYIEATTTGTYTCNISQTSGDVDYLLWGPYTTKQIGCNNVPNQTPIRESYSAAWTENFSLPVVAGQYYILMVTNFSNDPGRILIETNQLDSSCNNADFNYSAPAFCKDEAPASPTFVNNGVAGTFTFTPAGLSISPTTGVINFAASAAGTYVVTNTVIPTNLPPSPNTPIEHSVLVTVTQPADATIAYANNAVFCNSDSVSHPVIVTGNSGPNPIFSATPTGLQYALDPISGNIIPSLAQPGIYTVTMTIPANGGCALYSTFRTVEILNSPIIPYTQDVNACNSYVLPALTIGNYFTATGGTGTALNAGDVISTNQTIYIYTTNGICSSQDSFNVNIVSIPTPTFDYLTQPTCAIQTGSINITAPVSVGGTVPTNLFISEVTDANSGAVSYVELFNATGVAVNLVNYRLKMYNNGNAAPTWQQTLSGTIANNRSFVIKISNDPSIPGVVHDLPIPNSGVDNNDNIRLTTIGNVELDIWGSRTNTVFTPLGQPGYTYRRLASATPLPSTTWDASQWTALDPENYSNLGQYMLNASSYEYSVDGGTYQTSTTFTGLTPGTHSFIVHDLINNCYSAPVSFTINAVPYTTAVTDFTYTTPVCITSTTNPTPTLAAGFTSGGTFSYTGAVGSVLDLNTTNGSINLATSTAGTYVVTYNYPINLASCINANSSSTTITIAPFVTATFTQISNICQNTTAPNLPLLSNNNISGTWNAAINTSTVGITTYTFTPNPGQCGVGTTMDITIDPIVAPIFSPIANICQGDTAPLLLPTSNNGIAGIWNPLAINTANAGIFTYTFTPNSNQCSSVLPIQVTIIPRVTPTFAPVLDLCVGDANVTLPTTSTNSIDGSWSTGVVDTSVEGSMVYTFTPDATECANPTTMTVVVEQCEIQKGISPNGDDKNEFLKLKANKVEIFNRYGKEVYSKTNYNNDWHGQFMGGGDMPDGTYYYVIELVSGKKKTGWIYINREQ